MYHIRAKTEIPLLHECGIRFVCILRGFHIASEMFVHLTESNETQEKQNDTKYNAYPRKSM